MGKTPLDLFQIMGNPPLFLFQIRGKDMRNGRWTIYLLQHCCCQKCGVVEDVERSMSAYDDKPSRQSKATIWSPTTNISMRYNKNLTI